MNYESAYLVSALGYSGRVAVSDANKVYVVPLIDASTASISNAVTGNATNFDVPSVVRFPLLFTIVSTVSVRIRKRTVHPNIIDSSAGGLFTYMTTLSGYTNVAASTDLVRHATLPLANVGDGTTDTHFRPFDVIRTGTYGGLLSAGVYLPVVVNSFRDCWLQIIPRDGAGTGTNGEVIFTLASDNYLVGY